MAKVTDVSTRFGLHPDTIRDWADQFSDFLSPGARKGASLRRNFTYEDEIVLNTIHELRKQRKDFSEITARLAAGERNTTLPPIHEPVPQESALVVYAELRELKLQVQERDTEIERLRALLDAKDERVIRVEREKAVLEWRLKLLEKDDDE